MSRFQEAFVTVGSQNSGTQRKKEGASWPPAPSFPPRMRERLHVRHMPDHAAAFALLVPGGSVHAEIVKRLALIGPLLAAVVAGDDLEIAHVLIGRFGLHRRPVH